MCLIPQLIPNKIIKFLPLRNRIGDLEVDLIMGVKHKPALIVLADRSSLESDLIKSKKADRIAYLIIKRLKARKQRLKTLTFDNDLAFALHEQIAKSLSVQTILLVLIPPKIKER